ncbi:MAG: tRNA (adenosine(37)-N6)-threonylcarbamoyltransferase complex transferase subunit TsaD [Desulfobacteraceae bacterium]|nr:tRNA (adenosine(37)-N6)-threonylcarbamoyltransferase complex transferase subunit TsaD [Desulfobacteraceae bacterium]
MIVLGIESSCDETAAALVENGNIILSSVVASQTATHHKYGGVVPEIASRMHIEAIVPVIDKALLKAKLSIDQIDGVAATRGPGLIGALLIGFSFAKAFAYTRDIKLVGVNHLEGHIYSSFLSENVPVFPFISLVASGGHTNIYYVDSYDSFELMGQTRDDAVGEAFDKVSKMMGLGYPGGHVIEELAKKGNSKNINFPRSYLDKDSFDFSFSGIKSAVLRYITEHKENLDLLKSDIAAGFQAAVIDVLKTKLINACLDKQCTNIAITGGVAANQTFYEQLKKDAFKYGLKVFVPIKELCGDNAAMIAARGYRMLLNKNYSEFNHDVFSRNKIDSTGLKK